MAEPRTPPPTRCRHRRRRRSPSSSLNLLELDERAAEILRVEEEHGLAVRADLRLAIAENTRAAGGEAIARGNDVGDLVAEMVHAAARVLGEITGDRRVGAERLEQLDFGVGQLDEDYGHAVCGQRLRR